MASSLFPSPQPFASNVPIFGTDTKSSHSNTPAGELASISATSEKLFLSIYRYI